MNWSFGKLCWRKGHFVLSRLSLSQPHAEETNLGQAAFFLGVWRKRYPSIGEPPFRLGEIQKGTKFIFLHRKSPFVCTHLIPNKSNWTPATLFRASLSCKVILVKGERVAAALPPIRAWMGTPGIWPSLLQPCSSLGKSQRSRGEKALELPRGIWSQALLPSSVYSRKEVVWGKLGEGVPCLPLRAPRGEARDKSNKK